jgi:hypothetical protein
MRYESVWQLFFSPNKERTVLVELDLVKWYTVAVRRSQLTNLARSCGKRISNLAAPETKLTMPLCSCKKFWRTQWRDA